MFDEQGPVGEPTEPASPADPAQPAFTPEEILSPQAEQHPPPPGGWTYLDVFLFVLFAIPAQVAAVAVCMGGFLLYDWTTGGDSFMGDLLTKAPMVVAVQFVWWALLLGFIYGVIAVRHQLPFWPAIGWRALNRPPAVYLLWGVVLAGSVLGMSLLLPQAEGRMPIQDLINDWSSLVLLTFFGVLFAPVVEELVFRGFLFSVVERSHGPFLAVLVTSALFSLPHASQYGWRWQNLLLLTYVGVVFGIVRAQTQSVVPSTLLHAGYNATLFAGLLAAGDQIFST